MRVSLRRRLAGAVLLGIFLAGGLTVAAAAPVPESATAVVQAGSGDKAAFPGALRGGVLATFDVHGEVFRAWVTNSEAIEQLFALERGETTATIPIAPVRRGPGRAAHNRPWRWHFDPKQFALADFTIELCDATPSFVEANRRYFIKTVGSYCPWAAVLIELEDFR